MRSLLLSHEIQLTKSLGQNFLHDTNQLRKIAAAAELTREDKVLEIGPGLGPLTEILIEKAGHVFAIEKDARLVPLLRERFESRNNFELLHADALEFLRNKQQDWSGWKLVSNLPYSVGSPILVEIAESAFPPSMIVATLQLEVVGRILSKPGSEAYGLLSLLLQYRYQPAGHFKIPASCFFPPPDVESACVILKLKQEETLPPGLDRVFKSVVKTSFSQRRKMMFKLLKTDWPENVLRTAFEACEIPQNARAEEVGVEKFKELALRLQQVKR